MLQQSRKFEAEWARFEAYLAQKVGEFAVSEEGALLIAYHQDSPNDGYFHPLQLRGRHGVRDCLRPLTDPLESTI